MHPAISPDAGRMAFTAMDNGNYDIWIHNLVRGSLLRLTFDPVLDMHPVWSPDASQIAFSSLRHDHAGLLIRAADGRGKAQVLASGDLAAWAPDWSADGRYLIYHVEDLQNQRDLWYLPLAEGGEAVPFLRTPADEILPQWSPDGKYVAYMSDQSGRFEIYVKPFSAGEGTWQISFDGGTQPRWSGHQGNELFYLEGDRLMAVRVETRGGFRWSKPQPLFMGGPMQIGLESATVAPMYDVAPDGEHFVMVQYRPTAMILVQNWIAAFR